MSHIRLERITFWKHQDWNQMRYHCANGPNNGPNEHIKCCLFVNMKWFIGDISWCNTSEFGESFASLRV